MERAITLTTLILACCLCLASGGPPTTQHWMLTHHRKPTKLTTRIPLPNKTTLIAPTAAANRVDKTDKQREQTTTYYHPAAVQKPRLIERYDKRELDGNYEYRYVLSNGDVRYERAYWQPVGKTKILARKGYYSYPLPNHRFHTVFYTADHNGFREDESSYGRLQPPLPRRLEVPTFVNDVTGGGKPTIEKKTKINRKPNWTATTATILQKGRFSAIAQEAVTETMKRITFEASAASTTNRPQINIEDETIAKELAGIQTHTQASSPITATSMAIATTTATGASTLPAQSTNEQRNESLNPIKAESVQTEVMETETEQLKAVDTTTVLSVD